MRAIVLGAILLAVIVSAAGCGTWQASAPAATNSAAAASADAKPAGPPKTKITAYINVTSGCQAATVALLNGLGMKNRDLVDMEIIDFGSPEGERRWRGDGMGCMTILFNGSPVVSFPGKDGKPNTVIFTMPAGISWTHDDLQGAFAALHSKKLRILTEEEARRELAPKSVKLATKVVPAGKTAELQINGVPVLTIKAGDGDVTAVQRANAMKVALDAWAKEPVQPDDLKAAQDRDTTVLLAGKQRLIAVTEADAKAGGFTDPRQVAVDWLGKIKQSVGEAVQPESKE